MIHVIATITTQPGKRDELIAAFKKLAPEVHAEDGCIEYGTAVDIATPIAAQVSLRDDVVTVVEKWESIPALEAHLAAPHMEAFRNSMGDVITGISIQVLEPNV
ncbi:putative quinol monooxygenase [Aeoliella sp. SH292]|uniref:putative quinol monooxygenase n=1 Tax=Aeoliella sp. SH292 TaxID=3454464 RepID=UPI003F9ACA16